MRVHSCIYNITANQIKESWNAASFSKCDFANVKMAPPSAVAGPPIHYICSGCHHTRKNLSEPNEVPAHIILSSPKYHLAIHAGEAQSRQYENVPQPVVMNEKWFPTSENVHTRCSSKAKSEICYLL